SHYELVLPGGSPTLLSADSISVTLTQIDLTATDVDFGLLLDEPINFLHVRRKQHLDDDFVEQLVMTNYLGHAVELEFEIRFAADSADIFEVRGARRKERGECLPPMLAGDEVVLAYRGRDGQIYQTNVRFAPAPRALEPGSARFLLQLAPGEAQALEVAVLP